MAPQSRLLAEREAALIRRWKEIEALDSNEDTVSEEEFARQKEAWFGQAFSFLQYLPNEEHCWCSHSDVVWPLLEPFYNYFTVSQHNSALDILWGRLSHELGRCTQCVLQYHKAKELYAMDFLEDVVSTLLAVLQILDEKRVASHLQDILYKLRNNALDTDKDCGELICVLFEVLKFPMLLDDAEINSAFVPFLQYVENIYELTLAGDHCYPGVYALLFHSDQTTRGIALRLAASFGKLRTAADLEPIQPLLKKHMHCLEFDLFDQDKLEIGKENSTVQLMVGKRRPRASFTRESLWMGLKTLLGLLEPSAFEEGVVERYPSFLSIVLNHASEATPVFWNALHCLKLLLEVLGYKLWIKTTFSPGVMRSTLIGQCFHTREEKMHKAIFDLFQPFLKSLEALQDGEYERQRRNLLYFLLQQVIHSRNFSGLMNKKARQIAFLIVLRGFKLNPACPPLECVHVWGPPLVESVRDTQLYDSVRQPAITLLETIIIADSVILASLYSRRFEARQSPACDIVEFDEEDYEGLPANTEGMKDCHFMEYKSFDKLVEDCENWLCAPVFWVDILGRMLPWDFSESFLKAVLWALSRLTIVNQVNQSAAVETSVEKYPEILSSKEITSSLKWEVPKGCDDGADGKVCVNTVKVSSQGPQLLSLLKRCAERFLCHLQVSSIIERWSWDPFLAEALVLIILDGSETIRDFGRCALSWFAKDSSLESGLMFLCSTQAVATYVNSGLCYATKLLITSGLGRSLPSLQNFLFISWKLITLQQRKAQGCSGTGVSDSPSNRVMEGGFLKLPVYEHQGTKNNVEPCKEASLDALKTLQQLSGYVWHLILVILQDGHNFSEDNTYLMVFARMFDVLPLVFRNVLPNLVKKLPMKSVLQNQQYHSQESNGTSWIEHLLNWGDISTASIHRRWKAAMSYIVECMNGWHCSSEPELSRDVKDWLDRGTVLNDDMRNKLQSFLHLLLTELRHGSKLSSMGPGSFLHRLPDIEKEHAITPNKDKTATGRDSVIVLSDDETESLEELSERVDSMGMNFKLSLEDKPCANLQLSESNDLTKSSEVKESQNSNLRKSAGTLFPGSSRDRTLDKYFSSLSNKAPENSEASRKTNKIDHVKPSSVADAKTSRDPATVQADSKSDTNASLQGMGPSKSKEGSQEESARKEEIGKVLRELVEDNRDDIFKMSSNQGKILPAVQKRSLAPPLQPKRQLIQLQVPGDQLKSNAKRFGMMPRLAPQRMDEWYKRILSLDYFAVVGLSSDTTTEGLQSEPMRKVPISFKSSEQYMDVFRPLVLEEFKAQLQHSYDQSCLSDALNTGFLRLMSLEKVDDFEIGRFTAESGADAVVKAWFENDLLLLSRQPFQTGTQTVHMLGKVERQEKENKNQPIKMIVKFFLRSGSKRLSKARSLLMDRSKWHVTRLMSITPQLREFQALSSIENLPLLPIILNNGLSKPGSSNVHGRLKTPLKKLSEKLQNQLKADYNESQLQAIEVALESSVVANGHEVSLVQGPPGTGKTRTIVAIISALIAGARTSDGQFARMREDVNGAVHDSFTRSVSQSVAIARSWQAAALAKEQMNMESSQDVHRERYKSPRVLVCAQSNAAVDELVFRLCKEGLYDSNGGHFKPYLVRVGNPKTVHPNSLPVFIDTLIESRLEADKQQAHAGGVEKAKNTIQILRVKLDKIADTIQVLEAQLSGSHNSIGKGSHDVTDNSAGQQSSTTDEASHQQSGAGGEALLKVKLNMMYKQRRQISAELAMMEADERRSYEEEKNKRQLLKREIIRQAEVVVATLSGCGGDVYSACMEKCGPKKQMKSLDDGLFDAVVIDEAAQALEPATLIPLQLLKWSRAKCIMVGDPKQLPATVLSQLASRFSYECSMFERLQRGGYPVTMLSTQYRMHPEIRIFPSAHFYENQLQDGATIANGRHALFHADKHFGPYMVFDIVEGYEKVKHRSASQSLCNDAEVDAALEIVTTLKTRYPNEVRSGRLGIITPYQQQLSLLRERFNKVFGQKITEIIDFNTVDGFQGREVDIIILSTVRAAARNSQKISGVGFVADVRRMNVALTRARFALWIVCNVATLQTSPPWAALLKDAKERGVLHTVKSPYKCFFNDKNVDRLGVPTPLSGRNAPSGCPTVEEKVEVQSKGKKGSGSQRECFQEGNRLVANLGDDMDSSRGGSLVGHVDNRLWNESVSDQNQAVVGSKDTATDISKQVKREQRSEASLKPVNSGKDTKEDNLQEKGVPDAGLGSSYNNSFVCDRKGGGRSCNEVHNDSKKNCSSMKEFVQSHYSNQVSGFSNKNSRDEWKLHGKVSTSLKKSKMKGGKQCYAHSEISETEIVKPIVERHDRPTLNKIMVQGTIKEDISTSANADAKAFNTPKTRDVNIDMLDLASGKRDADNREQFIAAKIMGPDKAVSDNPISDKVECQSGFKRPPKRKREEIPSEEHTRMQGRPLKQVSKDSCNRNAHNLEGMRGLAATYGTKSHNFLTREWERFLKVLTESKILYPLPRGAYSQVEDAQGSTS